LDQHAFPSEQMGVGKIIGHTFRTYFRRFGSFAVFTLLISGVFSLAVFVLEQLNTVYTPSDISVFADLFEGRFGSNAGWQTFLDGLDKISADARTPAWVWIITFAASLFIMPIIHGGISYVSTGDILGEAHTPTEWLAKVLSKYKTLFVAYFCSLLFTFGIAILLVIASVILGVVFGIITALVPFLGILLIIAEGIALLIALMFLVGVLEMAFPVMIREGLTGFSPIIRALRLGLTRFWRTVGVVVLAALISGVASGIISSILSSILGFTKGIYQVMFFNAALINVIVSLFIDPLTLIALNMNYISISIGSQANPGQINDYSPGSIPSIPEQVQAVPGSDAEPEEDPSSAPDESRKEENKNGDDDPQGPELL